MTTRTGPQKIARAIQRICEDETGVKPKYMLCLDIATKSAMSVGLAMTGVRKEERASALFLAFRDRLVASATRSGSGAP